VEGAFVNGVALDNSRPVQQLCECTYGGGSMSPSPTALSVDSRVQVFFSHAAARSEHPTRDPRRAYPTASRARQHDAPGIDRHHWERHAQSRLWRRLCWSTRQQLVTPRARVGSYHWS